MARDLVQLTLSMVTSEDVKGYVLDATQLPQLAAALVDTTVDQQTPECLAPWLKLVVALGTKLDSAPIANELMKLAKSIPSVHRLLRKSRKPGASAASRSRRLQQVGARPTTLKAPSLDAPRPEHSVRLSDMIDGSNLNLEASRAKRGNQAASLSKLSTKVPGSTKQPPRRRGFRMN